MGHILLVSAKDEITENVPKYLSLLGYKVKSASNPRQAMQLFDGGMDFDLIITALERTEDAAEMVRHVRKSLLNLSIAASFLLMNIAFTTRR